MRFLLSMLLAAAATATAAQEAPPARDGETPAVEEPAPPPGTPLRQHRATGQSDLDMWFERLAAAKDEGEGRTADGHIQQIWLKSGSDTVDLLMGWALQALNEKDYALALDLLDAVTTMKPDFAEGWNKRGTVHYMMDNYGASLADIERTLALEPRHYGAISGLGLILKDLDQPERALETLRRALDLNPFMDAIPDVVDELEKKLGNDI